MPLAAAIRNRQAWLPPDRDGGPGGGAIVASTAWSGLGVGATAVLQLVRSMIFARLLMPEDFGIMGLANVFTQFVLIFANFGFNQSVIYHKDLDRQDLSTCFWANMGVDAGIAAICAVAALVMAQFTGDTTTALVICLLALQFVFTSFGSINNSLMRRMFMFREIAILNFVNAVVTFAASWALVALAGWGVYGLAVGMAAGTLVHSLLNFHFLPWVPSFSFSRTSFTKHLGYGRWLLGVSLVTFTNSNLDRFTIGTLLSKAQLGFYEYASNIPLMLVQMLSRVLNGVLFSAFASLQDRHDELRRLLLKVYRYNAMLIFPMMAGMALVAEDFIMVAYGEKWMPILLPMRLFCLLGMVQLFTQPLYPLCNAIGKPQLPFRWSLVYLPVNVATIYAGVKLAGMTGVVAGRIVLPVFMIATVGREVMNCIDLPWRRIFRASLPALLGCGAMAAAVYAFWRFDLHLADAPIVHLVTEVAVGAVVYVVFMALFFRGELMELVNQLRRR